MEGNLTFDSEQEIIVEYTDSYFIVIDEQDNQEVEEVVPSLFMNNPTYLQPNSKYEQVSLIKTHEPISTVGYIYLSFPHPIRGEGEEIEVEEEYGLYLIDQVRYIYIYIYTIYSKLI